MQQSNDGPARWEKLGHTVLARTRVFDLHSVRYRHPQRGTERDFVVMRPPGWVNVVALTTDQQLVLVRQFRFGVDDFALEIPGGLMNAHETPQETGARELREETGFAGDAAILLGSVQPNPAIQSNLSHVVLITGARRTSAMEWDADEEIEVTTRPVEEVLAAARRGEIAHSLVLSALFLFEPRWRKMQARGV
ncbi:MAG: NUDIX hydrolase [Opitutaceae bacterium]|nr:NUDIX hydrolase [Opitutaceae bacterium]